MVYSNMFKNIVYPLVLSMGLSGCSMLSTSIISIQETTYENSCKEYIRIIKSEIARINKILSAGNRDIVMELWVPAAKTEIKDVENKGKCKGLERVDNKGSLDAKLISNE